MNRIVVCDCDGTLVDGQAAICDTMDEAFAAAALPRPTATKCAEWLASACRKRCACWLPRQTRITKPCWRIIRRGSARVAYPALWKNRSIMGLQTC